MTIIKWKFEDQDGEITVDDSKFSRVVLSNGEVTMIIDQKKMVRYLNWIIQQELKHG